MSKFYGKIGYAEQVETRPGVWEERITERAYFGEVRRNIRNLQNDGQVNDDVNIASEFSIVADPFAYQNFHSMRYIEFMDAKWKITKVDVQHPRLNLTVGGLYNGQ